MDKRIGTSQISLSTGPVTDIILNALDMLEDSVVIFDHDWRYVFVNKAGWNVLGRSRQEVLGTNVWDLLPHLKGTAFEANAHKAMQTQTRIEIEEYYPLSQRHARIHFYPSSDFLMVHITDISDLVNAKRMNDQLLGNLQQAMEVYWSEENRQRREAKGHKATQYGQ